MKKAYGYVILCLDATKKCDFIERVIKVDGLESLENFKRYIELEKSGKTTDQNLKKYLVKKYKTNGGMHMVSSIRKSELDQTIDVIETMTDEELQAVRTVAVIIMNKKITDRPFHRLTEEEFFSHVDEGLAELDAGLGEDSDLVDAELATEFGLKL